MKTFMRILLLVVIAVFQLGFTPQAVFAQSSECQGAAGPDCPVPEGDEVTAQAGAYFKTAYSATLRGGYVAHGIGMRNTGYGTIQVTDVPAGSTVVKAYLFWAVIGPASVPGYYYYKGVFNTSAVTGTLIGKSAQPYWLRGRILSGDTGRM